MIGEHDAGSRAEVAHALREYSPARFVLVDLTACTFIDSTILGLFFHQADRYREAGGRLDLVAERGNTTAVTKSIELTRVRQAMRVHESREDGLASMRTALPQRPTAQHGADG